MIVVETRSVNGAVYASVASSQASAEKYIKDNAQKNAGACWILEDGRRVVRAMWAFRKWTFTDVDLEAETARLVEISAHGEHAFTYGMFPRDGGLCLVCGATKLANAMHTGESVYQL